MRLVIAILMLMSASLGFSQTSNGTSESSNIQPTNIIDGSKNPEKIRDVDAYRLFLAAVAPPANASPEQKDQQFAFLQHILLGKADFDSVIKTLVDFSDKYATLIQNYNTSAAKAAMNNVDVDIKDFLTQRDLLVDSVRNELQITLTPDGMRAVDSFVQSEKKNMQVAVEDLP
jgi:hypothetical protein